MSETKLLPCPMCGCDTPRDDVYIRDGREVQCPSCGCSVHAFNPDANQHAIAKWNTRTPDPRNAAAQGLADALKVEFEAQNCVCGMLKYIGQEPPCGRCIIAAALAAWEKAQ